MPADADYESQATGEQGLQSLTRQKKEAPKTPYPGGLSRQAPPHREQATAGIARGPYEESSGYDQNTTRIV